MKLKRVSLVRARGHECPGVVVSPKARYLAVLTDGRMAAATFTRQWYGLNFDGFYDAGLQFDAPGTNGSGWKALYRIVTR